MKVNNSMGLPQAFVEAVSVDRHNKAGHYSATTLNKGIKEIVLTDRHWDELETDAAENVWAIWGTAMHSVMEKQKDNNFREELFEVEVETSRGTRVVSGRVDSYDMENEILYDWKSASTWKVIYKDFDDWKKQGLTYAWLMNQNGLNVKKCKFVAMLKDWSATEAKRKPDYPQMPVYVYEFDVTPEDLVETSLRIISKVEQIVLAEQLKDDEIEPCTSEERWATDEQWAVKKVGTKKAIPGGVCNTLEEAQKLVEEKGGKGFEIEHREPTSRKCEDYCICKEKCSFYKSLHREPENGSVD